MMIRVQEQDNNANGYLNSNVSSIGILQLVLMIANVQEKQTSGSILEDLNW